MMTKVRYRRYGYDPKTSLNEYHWIDAWLIQLLADPHSSDGVKAVVAFQDDEYGSEQGLKIAAVKNLNELRIARQRIPLYDDPAMERATQMPDAAN